MFDNIVKVLTETNLQSNKLKMWLVEQEKTLLSNTDDKQVWIGRPQKYEDFDTTLAWGHYRLNTPSILCAYPSKSFIVPERPFIYYSRKENKCSSK